MPNIEVKFRRGTATEHSSFTGAEGEVTVDTTNDTLRVHDGSTTGGHKLLKEDDPNLVRQNDSSLAITNTTGNASIEVGGGSGTNDVAFVDLKNPNTDDYDLRLISVAGTPSFPHISKCRIEGRGGLGLCAGDPTNPADPLHEVVTINPEQIFIKNSSSTPSSNPSNGGYLYVENGALKYRGSSGTVTTIANA